MKSRLPAEEVVGAIRHAVAELDPVLPLYQTGTVEQMLGFALFPSQAAAVALSTFGVLALLLAATGIHGLVAYAVSRRRRELGIRIAIGASRWSILRLVLGRLTVLLAIGAAAGLAMAVAAGTILSSIVFEASPRDPAALAAVTALIIAVGLASCWMPARRSIRIEPGRALRAE